MIKPNIFKDSHKQRMKQKTYYLLNKGETLGDRFSFYINGNTSNTE